MKLSVKVGRRSVLVEAPPNATYKEVFQQCGLPLPAYWESDYRPYRARTFYNFSDTLAGPIQWGNTIQLRQKREG